MQKSLTPLEGYDWKNYDYKQGINPSGEDIVSNLVIEQVIDLILGGYADTTIKNLLYNTYGMNSYAVQFIINKAHKSLHTRTEKQTENLLEKQNSRLFKLYRDSVDRGDNKTALSVLSEINKLNKLYITKVEVSTDNYILDFFNNDNKSKED